MHWWLSGSSLQRKLPVTELFLCASRIPLYPHLPARPEPPIPHHQATNKCFEVLGIASKPPDQQLSAARSLVSLCTHPDLRPAVDPLLVLRRLGRVVECTRAPAALGAALEALVAVADDAGWEEKVGRTETATVVSFKRTRLQSGGLLYLEQQRLGCN